MTEARRHRKSKFPEGGRYDKDMDYAKKYFTFKIDNNNEGAESAIREFVNL
jgi:hypothetical protein